MAEKLTSGPKVGHDLTRVSAGLTRGPNKKKSLNAAAWSGTWPAPGATLDLDFANDRGFVRGVGQGRSMDAVTFTRASSANWVDSTGVLRTGAGTFTGTANALGNNLLTFPQDFDNAAWSKSNATVVANAEIAPDETLTAERINSSASNGTITQSYTASAGDHTFSVYLKRVSGTGNIDITCHSGGTWVTQTITDSWARYTVTQTLTAGARTPGIRIATSGDVILAWGAQLETGSSATTYYPTNINVPRFDWASTAQRPQNFITYSENFDVSAVWAKIRVTVSVNTLETTDPVNTNTANKVIEDSANNNRSVYYQFNVNITDIWTWSLYVKSAGNSRWLRFQTSADSSWFNPDTGLWGTVAAGLTSSVTNIGNGWYRVSLTGAPSGTRYLAIGLSTSNNQSSYAGDGTSGLYVWGAQVEVGSTATTYIANGAYSATNNPLAANTTCNGLLIEESRTNRLLWCRDATSGTGNNIFTYSQTLNNAVWVATNVTVTTGVTDPNSGTTAVTLTASADNATFYQTLTLKAAPYTLSFYVKRTTGTGNIDFTLDGTNFTTISAPTGSWVRYSITATPTAGSKTIGIRIATNTDAIDVAFAQLNLSNVLTDYQSTTTAAVYGWGKSSVTVAKDQTGVDGVANAATSITSSASNGTLIQPIDLGSGSRTGSVYLKRITGTGNVQVSLDGSTWSTVDLSSTEWRRIVLSGTVTNPTIGIRLATNGDAVAMDYGQIEDGAFATSPILTTTATVTRPFDVADITGANFSQVFNRDRATLYSKFTTRINGYGFELFNGNAEDMGLALNNSGQARFFSVTNSVNDVDINTGPVYATASVAATVSLAASVCRDNFCLYANNTFVGADFGGLVPKPIQMSIGRRGANNGNSANGCINRVVITGQQSTWPALQELTR